MATLKELYNALKSDGAPLPDTYEKFESYMTSGPKGGYEHRKQVYDSLKADGAPLPDTYEAFSNALFSPVEKSDNRNKVADVAPKTPESASSQPAEKKQEGWKPTPMQKAFMMDEIQSVADSAIERMHQSVENTRRLAESYTDKGRGKRKAAEMQARVSGTPTRVLGLTPNTSSSTGGNQETPKGAVNPNSPVVHGVKFESGVAKTEWMLPDGSLSTFFIDADKAEYGARQARLQYEFIKRMEQNGLNPAKKGDVEKQKQKDRLDTAEKQTRIRLAENEENLHKLYDNRAKGLDKEGEWRDEEGFWSNFVRIVGGAANRSVTANTPKPRQSMTTEDKSIGTYLTENQVLTDAKKLLETRKLSKSNGFMGGFWKIGNNWRNMKMGARHALSDADLYGGGVMALQKATQLMSIEEKLKQGTDLSDAEVSLIYSTMLGQDVRNNIETPHGYNAAQITVEMFPFMAQMALNPASGLSRAMVTKFGKSGLRKIATKKAAEGLTGEAAEAYAKREMRKLAAKTVGVQVLGDVAEASVLANTLQAPKTAANVIERYQGDVTQDEEGNLSFDGSHKWGEAIYKAEMSAIIENYTEMLGEHFGIIGNSIRKGIGKGLRTVGGGKIVDAASDMIGKIGSNEWAKAIGEVEKRAHWNGTVGEILEEEAGIVLNSIFTGDNKISDLWDADQQIDIVLGVGLFGGFVSGLRSVGYPIAKAKAKRNLRTSNNIGSWRFGEEWSDIRDQIENADEKDLGIVIRDLVRMHAKSDEQGKAIVEYGHALMNARGYEIASASSRSEGTVSPEQQDLEESFEHGEQLAESEDAQAMNDTKLEMERARGVLVGSVGEDMVQEIDADPIAGLAKLAHDWTLHESLADYVNAKAVYDGMIQRVRDDIDGRVEQSNVMIESRINRDTGMIQPATLKIDDRRVYIVSGTVAMYDDGTGVDSGNSSESIIIRDAETGKVEFADPSHVSSVEAGIDADEEKEAARNQIIDEIARPAADNIDGVLSFAPGETYSILDLVGNELPVSVLGQTVDEDGVPAEGYVDIQFADGSIETVATSDLQQWVDDANARRVAQFDEERREQRAAEEEAARQSRQSEVVSTDDGFIPIDPGVKPDENGVIDVPAPGAADANAGISEEPKPSALSQIPIDESGEPIYEQAEPDMAWDALVEQTDGDEEIAAGVIGRTITEKEEELKALSKQKGKSGLTVSQKIEEEKNRKKAMDAIQQSIDHWKRMAGTKQRRQADEDAVRREESRKRAEERAEAEKAEREAREEAERIEREALEGVPDWSLDTPHDARARGYRRNGPQKVDRQENVAAVQGKEVEVKFGDNELPKGHAAIINAATLQPSHIQGSRNPLHFLDEAQPKEREDAASVDAARKIASNIRPEEITTGTTAYTGAPTVNMRGETIQGNSRSDALRLMYESYPEQAARYRQYLIDHAADYGLMPEQISSVEHPVLVNMLDAADDEAIRLGQFVAQDTESGGIERIKARNVVQRMGKDLMGYSNILLRSNDEEASVSQLIDANGTEALKWLVRKGHISETQYQSAFDSKGDLTAEARNDLQDILYENIFTGGSTQLKGMFRNIPVKAQRAILATAHRDRESGKADSLKDELQQSIIAFNEMMNYPDVAQAKDLAGAIRGAETWSRQYSFDDVTGESVLPSEKFSNFALRLAAIYRGGSQRFIQQTLTDLFDAIQGTAQDTLFEEADKTPRSLREAVKKVLDIDYEPVNRNRNESDRRDAVDLDIAQGETGGSGSAGDAESGGREPDRARGADGGEGASEDSGAGNDVGLSPDESLTPEGQEAAAPATMGSRISEAETRVDTNPTDAQKEAGNYRKGHVQVGAFDVTIENPKGSKRSGTDRDGKRWETTMTHTYGYIRGTKGVDGDHIDVYLSSDIDGWDGRKVFVVDQYNPDGTFDEHKVMLGFNDQDDAFEAYLSNYEAGWEKGRRLEVTGVSLDDFEKWIDSSKRKTKAFAEYKSIKSKENNSIVGRSLSEQEASDLIARMETNAEVAPAIKLTPENWITLFGEDGGKGACV